ncbi:MAG: hypothetical protein M3N52_11975 [Actinomycetota bacterium]|nr:hypothetical protein [Actinomycetota bacterium]
MTHCVRGVDCLDRDPGGWGAPLGRDPGPLCRQCADRATSTLYWLPDDYTELTQIIARRNSPNDAKIMRPRPGPTPPIDLAIDTVRNRIVWVATIWEDIVREHADLPPKPAGKTRESYELGRAATILAPRVNTLAGIGPTDSYTDGLDAGPVTRDGAYALDQLIRLHKLARTLVGATVRVLRLPGECPRCHAWTQCRADGSDTVHCQTCEHRWPYPDYTRHVRAKLALTNPQPDRP